RPRHLTVLMTNRQVLMQCVHNGRGRQRLFDEPQQIVAKKKRVLDMNNIGSTRRSLNKFTEVFCVNALVERSSVKEIKLSGVGKKQVLIRTVSKCTHACASEHYNS